MLHRLVCDWASYITMNFLKVQGVNSKHASFYLVLSPKSAVLPSAKAVLWPLLIKKKHLLLNDIVFPSQEVSQRLSALALCFCNICPTSILWGNDNALCKEAVLPHHHHGKKCSPASCQEVATNIIHMASYQGSQADISGFMLLLSLAEAATITNYNMIVTWWVLIAIHCEEEDVTLFHHCHGYYYNPWIHNPHWTEESVTIPHIYHIISQGDINHWFDWCINN